MRIPASICEYIHGTTDTCWPQLKELVELEGELALLGLHVAVAIDRLPIVLVERVIEYSPSTATLCLP